MERKREGGRGEKERRKGETASARLSRDVS